MENKKALRALLAIGGLFLMSANLLVFTGCNTKSDDLKTATLLVDDTVITDDDYPDGSSGGSSSEMENYVEPYGDDYVQPYGDNYVEPQNGDNYIDVPPQDGGDSGTGDRSYAPGTEPEGYVNPEQNGDGYNNGGYSDGGYNDGGSGFGGQNDCFSGANPECKEKALRADLRDIERMTRELERMKKENSDNSATLQTLIDELSSLKERLNNATSQEEVDSTRTLIWDVQKELDVYRMQGEIARMQKELERETKQHEKDREFLTEMKDSVSSEWKTKIDEQIERMDKIEDLMNQMITAMEAGEGWETIDDLRWTLDDLRWEFGDFWQEFEEIKNQQWATQMLDDVERSIAKFEEFEYPNLPEEWKAKADEMISVAKTLIEEGRKALEDGDTEALEEIQMKLDELRMKGESFLGKPKTGFQEMGFTEEFDANFENFSGDMSYEKQMELVKKILAANPDMIEQILLGDQLLAERTLKILGRVPQELQTAYLEAKADLVKVFEEALAAQPDLASYKEDILGFNYFGDALDDLVEYLKSIRDGSINVGELVSDLAQLKNESKEKKYEAGVVSFPDYDDSDWYYDSVEQMSDFLSGKKEADGDMVFAGGDRITFAETLKIVLEKFGLGASDGTPNYGSAQNHWSRGYYATAEQEGITLLEPNHLITRGEMARLIVEVTIGDPDGYTVSSFSDLDPSDQYFNYLETLHEYGVISGDTTSSGASTVRSNDTINRAETAKVVNSAYENLQFNTVETGDFEELLEGL